jgi:hypothetical protein
MDAVDYDELWGSIERSPFAGTYIDELYRLAQQVVTLAEDVFRVAPKPTGPDHFLQIDHDVMHDLFTLVSSAAHISAMVGERKKQPWQTEQTYEIQRRRAGWLRTDVLKGVKLSALFQAKVRNTLEHFDEYIDEGAIGFATHQHPTPSLAPVDFVVSRRHALRRFAVQRRVPHLFFMRVFIASERVFVNCGHEISIQALHTECRRIVKRLAPFMQDREREGSSMLVISIDTFR